MLQDILNVIQTTPRNRELRANENKFSKLLHSLKEDTLKFVCQDLGLEAEGRKDALTSRILNLTTMDENGDALRPSSTTSDTSSQVA